MVMFSMSVYGLFTAAITISSKNPAQILAGRILNCRLAHEKKRANDQN